MKEIDVYQVNVRSRPIIRLVFRGWQAEWDGCRWAPRAWTEVGANRKARRWIERDLPSDAWIAWRRWIRCHITRRGDWR